MFSTIIIYHSLIITYHPGNSYKTRIVSGSSILYVSYTSTEVRFLSLGFHGCHLKMATSMFNETLDNYQHLTRLIPKTEVAQW
jgi:hypothetical protein